MLSYSFRIVIIISFLLVSACGPGVSDGEWHISGKYYYSDSGHHESNIVYRGDDSSGEIVVDSKVVEWFSHGNYIYAARIPRLIYTDNGITKSKLSSECEFFRIDTTEEAIIGPYGLPLKLRPGENVVPNLNELSC